MTTLRAAWSIQEVLYDHSGFGEPMESITEELQGSDRSVVVICSRGRLRPWHWRA